MKLKLQSLIAGSLFTVGSLFAQDCPPPVVEEVQTLCTGAKVGDIVVTASEGATVHYFFVGFVLQEVFPPDDLIDGGRYSISQTIDNCISSSASLLVNLTDAPAEPGGAATQQFTTGDTVRDLDISVIIINTVKWYIRNDAFEYILIESNTALEDGTTYYVTQSNGNCESAYHAITVNQIMGAVNPVLKSLRVYPNPASNTITITNSDVISQITLSNLLGQKVLSHTNNDISGQVNVSVLPAGTYILQVQTAKGLGTIKVVKQ